VVKPNLEELIATHRASGASFREEAIDDEAAVRAFVATAAAEYWERWGTSLAVTRGSKPTLFWDGEGLAEAPVERIIPLNPIGSGDAFTAGLVHALLHGAGMGAAVAFATRLGARNALELKPGCIGPKPPPALTD
jgi:1-phosphofructokinase/tagatose 6-phosphate kinase